MASNLETPLVLLLSRLKNWLSIHEFGTVMDQYFQGTRSAAELADYRAKSGALKKLRDEVTPVLHHLKFIRAEGEVKFELGDGIPDCWIRNNPLAKPQGIEVTIAQSREQHHLGKELNEKGVGRGFLGLPDDASQKEFSNKLASPRIMYSPDFA